MRVFSLNIPKAAARLRSIELSREARHRLRMMMWYDEHGRNAALTCRHFGISRDTFYRWKRRFEGGGPGGRPGEGPQLEV
jgi:transposase-like protein